MPRNRQELLWDQAEDLVKFTFLNALPGSVRNYMQTVTAKNGKMRYSFLLTERTGTCRATLARDHCPGMKDFGYTDTELGSIQMGRHQDKHRSLQEEKELLYRQRPVTPGSSATTAARRAT